MTYNKNKKEREVNAYKQLKDKKSISLKID